MWSSFICIIAMLGCGSCIDFLSSGKVRNVDCYVQFPHFKTLAKKSFLWVRYAIIVKKKSDSQAGLLLGSWGLSLYLSGCPGTAYVRDPALGVAPQGWGLQVVEA